MVTLACFGWHETHQHARTQRTLYCGPRSYVGGGIDLDGNELAHRIVDALVDRMVSDVVLLDLTSLFAFTDYFVIGTVDNVRQARAVIDGLDEFSHETATRSRPEGAPDSGWVLVDFGAVVVHLFSLEQRAYYDLEEMWSAAREVVHIQ